MSYVHCVQLLIFLYSTALHTETIIRLAEGYSTFALTTSRPILIRDNARNFGSSFASMHIGSNIFYFTDPQYIDQSPLDTTKRKQLLFGDPAIVLCNLLLHIANALLSEIPKGFQVCKSFRYQ